MLETVIYLSRKAAKYVLCRQSDLNNFIKSNHQSFDLTSDICLIYKYYSKLKLLMNVQQDHCSKKTDNLCSECCLFYGSETFGGLCSSCHKKDSDRKKEEIVAKSPAETSTPVSVAERQVLESIEELSLEPAKREQKDKKRCFDCNKKVGLLGIECKCSYVYCNAHRLPQDHSCEFDHKNVAKQKLKKDVVKIYNGKIAQI